MEIDALKAQIDALKGKGKGKDKGKTKDKGKSKDKGKNKDG